MQSKLPFALPKLSFRGATRRKYGPDRCASSRLESAKMAFGSLFLGQAALVFRRAINFCVHETKLSRYHLNS